MNSLARREAVLLGVVGVIFLVLLLPALLEARAERRDGIRRDEVAATKRALEQYFNEHEVYPLSFDASPHQYVVETSEAAVGWYVRAELENDAEEIISFDEEAGRNYWYRIVRDGPVTYYDVCGGEFSCGATDAQREARE